MAASGLTVSCKYLPNRLLLGLLTVLCSQFRAIVTAKHACHVRGIAKGLQQWSYCDYARVDGVVMVRAAFR